MSSLPPPSPANNPFRTIRLSQQPEDNHEVSISLATLTLGQPSKFNEVRLTGLDQATRRANEALLKDRDAVTKLELAGAKASIIDPTEILERIVHCIKIGGKVFDGDRNEITEPEIFIAEYARTLLDQFNEIGVFNAARFCTFNTKTGKGQHSEGFRPDYEDVKSSERIVWLDIVLKREHKAIHSSQSGYLLQRICAAAMLQKPKSALQIASSNASRKMAVAKLPFPESRDDGLLHFPEAHVAVGDGVILTVRSSRVRRIDSEFDQFITGNVTTSGCILEYLITRSGEGIKHARDRLWGEIRGIEDMQESGKPRQVILRRLQRLEDVASNLQRNAQRVNQRLAVETPTIDELYPDDNFAAKWGASWSTAVQGLDGVLERIRQERNQIQAQFDDEVAKQNRQAAKQSRLTSNAFTIMLGSATIIQALSFIVEGGGVSLPRIAVAVGILGATAGIFWRGLNHQAKLANGNGDETPN